METRFQKWVMISYLSAAALLGYIVFSLSQRLAGVYDLETRIRNIDFVIQGAALLIAGICFLVLYRHQKVNTFMNEVMVELSRVSWPTQKETTSATMIVLVMVIISGVLLGVLDYLWTVLLKSVL